MIPLWIFFGLIWPWTGSRRCFFSKRLKYCLLPNLLRLKEFLSSVLFLGISFTFEPGQNTCNNKVLKFGSWVVLCTLLRAWLLWRVFDDSMVSCQVALMRIISLWQTKITDSITTVSIFTTRRIKPSLVHGRLNSQLLLSTHNRECLIFHFNHEN